MPPGRLAGPRRGGTRPPQQAAGTAPVTQGVGAPDQYRDGRQGVDDPDEEARLGGGAVGQGVHVDRAVEVLAGGQRGHRARAPCGTREKPKLSAVYSWPRLSVDPTNGIHCAPLMPRIRQ